MTTTPGQRAAADLLAVRDQWGDLLAAIETPPAAEWPPRDSRALGADPAADAIGDDPVVGRTPLTLREHPAPLNLRALDAALDVEAEVFDMCDAVAARVQRPARRVPIPAPGRDTTWAPDPDQATDPARWHTAAYRLGDDRAPVASAGSRRYGLHWAAVWLEGRALAEPDGDLFAPTPAPLVDQIAAVARTARRRVEGALGRDTRTTALDDPCPWCRSGRITVHARGGDPRAAYAVCSTPECPAPTATERGRRVWRGPGLVALWSAVAEARQQLAA